MFDSVKQYISKGNRVSHILEIKEKLTDDEYQYLVDYLTKSVTITTRQRTITVQWFEVEHNVFVCYSNMFTSYGILRHTEICCGKLKAELNLKRISFIFTPWVCKLVADFDYL